MQVTSSHMYTNVVKFILELTYTHMHVGYSVLVISISKQYTQTYHILYIHFYHHKYYHTHIHTFSSLSLSLSLFSVSLLLQCFSSIVGPNGSGKSNVIDSMLFVFGYRARKIRSKKVAVLIHNSEHHQNIQSCTVSVHFQKIIDLVRK